MAANQQIISRHNEPKRVWRGKQRFDVSDRITQDAVAMHIDKERADA